MRRAIIIITCWAVSKCHAQNWDTTHVFEMSDSIVFSDAKNEFYCTDKYGKWLSYKIGSDTLELFPPKIRYIKLGKKIIKLDAK